MALIKCSDCQKEHSDLAQVCPNCGRPARVNQPVLIEQTAKRWKDLQIIGVVLALISLPLMMADAIRVLAILLAVGAIGLIIYARYQAWYHHR